MQICRISIIEVKMKNDILELYDNATDLQKEFIDAMLLGFPMFAVVSRKENPVDPDDVLIQMNVNKEQANIIRYIQASADLDTWGGDALFGYVVVATINLMSKGIDTLQIKKIIDKAVLQGPENHKLRNGSERILH